MNILADATIDRLAAQNTASDVDDLQGGLAFVGDNPVAFVDEGEAVTIAATVVSNSH